MRFMMIMIPEVYGKPVPPDFIPDPEAVEKMGKYNEALRKAGILLALDGLTPPASGARLSFAGGKPKVTDGPFAEAKEGVGGYWMIPGEVPRRGDRMGDALPRRRQRRDRDPPGLRAGEDFGSDVDPG